MTIEIKDHRPSVRTLLCDAIRRHDMTEHVIIAGFDADMLRQFRDSCPGAATSAGSSEAALFYFLQRVRLESVYSPSALAMQVPPNFRNMTLTSRYVAAAHRRNLKVHVWTVNQPDIMAQLIQMGVDGIITDDPQRLLELVERQ
jgi:glycerophosphoryl diester phosphodiesterase